MDNKQFRKFILAEIDKIPINYSIDPDYIVMMARRIGTFGQFRLSSLYNKNQIVPFPARVIKIKFKKGEWVLKPSTDLRELYERIIKDELVGENNKNQNELPTLSDALASGQVEFIPKENNNG